MNRQKSFSTLNARITTMSLSIPHLVESKAQPWKDFFPTGDASAFTDSLYGNSGHAGAVERRWMQEEDCVGSRVATNGDNRSVQSSNIATSGSSFSHSMV